MSAGDEPVTGQIQITRPLRELFDRFGGERYTGPREEAVSALEHALQCADLALRAGATAQLTVAALLHDVGHFLDRRPDDDGLSDDRHEHSGARWLARWFGPEVTEPVRLHVDAKRFLCAVRPGYLGSLSPASVNSLVQQGGPFSPREAAAFDSVPYARDAVRLRVWDDLAKIPGKNTAPLDHYLSIAGPLFQRDTDDLLS